MTPLTIIGYLFTAAVTVSCVVYLRSGWLKKDLSVFAHRTWRDWVEILLGDLLAIGFLFGCYELVSAIGNPILDKVLNFTWLQFLALKGERVLGINQLLAGAQIRYFGIPFVILLFLNLPRLAAAEEESYRLGTKDWLHAIPRSLMFGLMHMVVGVPLWCGLALSVPGLWFTRQYFKGGVERSTMAHALYNMILASVLLIVVVEANLSPDATSPTKAGTGPNQSSQNRSAEKPAPTNVNK